MELSLQNAIVFVEILCLSPLILANYSFQSLDKNHGANLNKSFKSIVTVPIGGGMSIVMMLQQ
jgi:hypothetical protein